MCVCMDVYAQEQWMNSPLTSSQNNNALTAEILVFVQQHTLFFSKRKRFCVVVLMPSEHVCKATTSRNHYQQPAEHHTKPWLYKHNRHKALCAKRDFNKNK